ncbi:hypothetical protein [Acidiplasma sp.]|uniref:hypothetical protein n=1 Tax=Acidiplasma sp. TaxID=1872114 RepID=UPI0031638DC2
MDKKKIYIILSVIVAIIVISVVSAELEYEHFGFPSSSSISSDIGHQINSRVTLTYTNSFNISSQPGIPSNVTKAEYVIYSYGYYSTSSSGSKIPHYDRVIIEQFYFKNATDARLSYRSLYNGELACYRSNTGHNLTSSNITSIGIISNSTSFSGFKYSVFPSNNGNLTAQGFGYRNNLFFLVTWNSRINYSDAKKIVNSTISSMMGL